MAGRGTPATRAAQQARIAVTVHEYVHDPAAPAYGPEAAKALGVDRGRVLKTLVVDTGGRFAVVVLPVADQLDLKAAAAALGHKHATMADPAAAERSSGYVRGGISPLGQRKQLPTVVDSSATQHPTVFVSGGRRGLEIELDPADLVALTRAVVAPVARRT